MSDDALQSLAVRVSRAAASHRAILIRDASILPVYVSGDPRASVDGRRSDDAAARDYPTTTYFATMFRIFPGT